MKYEIVVGLEVHAELNTKTKIYCGCKNSFGSMVNSNCCPICTGMPGTLPTLNKSVVDYAVRMGYALHCSINNIDTCFYCFQVCHRSNTGSIVCMKFDW